MSVILLLALAFLGIVVLAVAGVTTALVVAASRQSRAKPVPPAAAVAGKPAVPPADAYLK